MFKVGDEVLYYDNRVIVRAIYENTIAVEFLELKGSLHNCQGDVPSGNGWYVEHCKLEHLPTDLNNI